MNKNQKVSKEELEFATKAMVNAGYSCVTTKNVQKVTNEFGIDVYVAVVGDAMAIYTPGFNNPTKFVRF